MQQDLPEPDALLPIASFADKQNPPQDEQLLPIFVAEVRVAVVDTVEAVLVVEHPVLHGNCRGTLATSFEEMQIEGPLDAYRESSGVDLAQEDTQHQVVGVYTVVAEAAIVVQETGPEGL
jgi:hypothetical protein